MLDLNKIFNQKKFNNNLPSFSIINIRPIFV